jgi:hypothetical protein
MNERILELAEQAREYAESKMHITGVKDSAAYDKKFAELIVKECIDYCGENLSKTVGGALKIHFGVEE